MGLVAELRNFTSCEFGLVWILRVKPTCVFHSGAAPQTPPPSGSFGPKTLIRGLCDLDPLRFPDILGCVFNTKKKWRGGERDHFFHRLFLRSAFFSIYNFFLWPFFSSALFSQPFFPRPFFLTQIKTIIV